MAREGDNFLRVVSRFINLCIAWHRVALTFHLEAEAEMSEALRVSSTLHRVNEGKRSRCINFVQT